MDAATVRERAGELPPEPGVYRFFEDGRVLYVGKALDLQDRVRSYTDPRSDRVREMVRRADTIDVAVTDTETQALLLEANLIKRHQPRYNVRLKDDKSYPLVQFTDHQFPRVEITRDPDPGSNAYGPFTDKGQLERVVKAIRETTGLRGCSDHKFKNRDRPCLDFDMGLCAAPCTDEIDVSTYAERVDQAGAFFEGETGALAEPLEAEMDRAAREHAFERAANIRDRLQTVREFHGTGGDAVIDTDGSRSVDVLGVSVEGGTATVARLHSEGGKLLDRTHHRVTVPAVGTEIPDILGAFILQFYAERALPDAVLLPRDPASADLQDWLAGEQVSLRVPGTGRERRLVDLAMKNAQRNTNGRDAKKSLADALGIDVPSRIEGFDVSHASGREVVGSNVVFVDGRPKTDGYRRKKLSETNDDYANMATLIEWRAARAIEARDDRPDPDLLLIDGGAGQLQAAHEPLDRLGWNVPMVALAKEDEIVHTSDRQFDWDADTPQLHLLQRVRDEAHRFAVQYHQTLREDISTVLESIDGIGPERRRRLLRRFGSVEGVRQATRDELEDVPGIGAETASQLASRL